LSSLDTDPVSTAGMRASFTRTVSLVSIPGITTEPHEVSLTVTLESPGWSLVEPPVTRTPLGVNPKQEPNVMAFHHGQRFAPDYPYQIEIQTHAEIGLAWADAQKACITLGAQLPMEDEWEWAARRGVIAPHGVEWAFDEFAQNDGGRIGMGEGFRLRTVRGVPSDAKKSEVPREPAAYRDSRCERSTASCPAGWDGIAFRCVRKVPR
jgi:hypothetical protein